MFGVRPLAPFPTVLDVPAPQLPLLVVVARVVVMVMVPPSFVTTATLFMARLMTLLMTHLMTLSTMARAVVSMLSRPVLVAAVLLVMFPPAFLCWVGSVGPFAEEGARLLASKPVGTGHWLRDWRRLCDRHRRQRLAERAI